jgi:hypothetical protein
VQKIFLAITTLGACLAAGSCFAQSELPTTSLCELQDKADEGTHSTVQVGDIYYEGIDMGVLLDPKCPQGTWVELALQSERNKKRMIKFLHRAGKCYVVFEGELYGPPEPDPKLPESLRSISRPGWGHLGAFRTKLVVHFIREVKAAPQPDRS